MKDERNILDADINILINKLRGEQFIAGVNDTGDKHKLANISANFCKNC